MERKAVEIHDKGFQQRVKMGNRKSLLRTSSVDILPNLTIRIPTVDEILEDEQHYYHLVSSLTATPYQYMVQLDDYGIDFTQINDFELFMLLFPAVAREDTGILFGDTDLSDIIRRNPENGAPSLYSGKNGLVIDEAVYNSIAELIRKVNSLKRETRKPGNEEARKFRIDLERKRQKRNARKPYEPYLEKLVVALVNRPEFKYNYEQAGQMTIYQFSQSFEQIKTSINFDNTMTGVYTGTIDMARVKDRSCLTWLPVNQQN